MTTIEFFGGLGVIGSSKIVIAHGDARVQLDMGLDIPNGEDLMAAPVGLGSRPGRELADLLRIGAAPRVPGLYDPRWLPSDVASDELTTDAAGEHALFISHGHLDHMGLAGFVRPAVPVYATPQTIALLRALQLSGEPVLGAEPDWLPIEPGAPVTVGDLTVEALPVDHDVVGACGFLVTTPDGRIAFTGDLRFHGEEARLSRDFIAAVAGVDVLITEGTTLSWEPLPAPVAESDAVARFHATLDEARGLVLVALYPRNTLRAGAFVEAARAAGRRLVWPGRIAALFARLGWEDVVTWDASRPQASDHREAIARAEGDGLRFSTVSIDAVRADPGRFVVMPDPHDLPSLLDLPLGPGDVLLHSNGQPLGDFDTWWRPFIAWLGQLGVELRSAGSGGHASADDLHAMVEQIAPRVVFPIHTFSPRRLQVPAGTRRVIAEYGVKYRLAEL
ncbi:MBL fold metallo-hydrolase [Gryllotalpicola protaetiae]|uniref:MBL fold metallo-hydrolase n=1 Tax=Gryllotalpicola protaetiae TaxID=2419771 RepID=A0A387BP90_9MICO|nr:MBL fold metallo-hydrolase [Gryllotalpicola protaetiae]AYG03864.1 MBL fold metallo-hydrolase [Gryllotalpicola protaetiae]